MINIWTSRLLISGSLVRSQHGPYINQVVTNILAIRYPLSATLALPFARFKAMRFNYSDFKLFKMTSLFIGIGMTKIWMIIIVVISVIIIKAILNGYKLSRVCVLEKDYKDYLAALQNQTATWDFHEKVPEIRELLIKAGQGSSQIPDVVNLDVGVVQVTRDIFDNMTANDTRVASFMLSAFRQAIGVYKKRLKDSFNPFYWLEYMIFLPQNIINYILGGEAIPNWLIRLVNMIYWIVGGVSAVIKIIEYFK